MAAAKEYDFAGLAGCVTQRTTRKGRRVGLYHSGQAGLDVDPTCKWSTVCEAHGCLVGHASLALAKQSLSQPEEWCDTCRAVNDLLDAWKARGSPDEYLLDGAPVRLDEFLAANEDGLDHEIMAGLADLRPGETFTGGGGAAAGWVFTRVKGVVA